MRIAITGASGLIGSALAKSLNTEVINISRQNGAWNPAQQTHNQEFFKNLDVVIHLAGEGIANRRWNEKQKELLYTSRINTTEFLAKILKDSPPKLFICASGIGYYGSCKDEILTEKTPVGKGFLAELSKKWEEAADKIKADRSIKLRLGVVLAKDGGALNKMLLPFKLGLGGPIGTGQQYMSWISIADVIGVIKFCIDNQTINGPINLCSPNSETNKNFSKKLATALHRPCLFPLPEFMVKLIFGEMGEELLLSSTRATPEKLLAHGFKFKHETLEQAFLDII